MDLGAVMMVVGRRLEECESLVVSAWIENCRYIGSSMGHEK